MSHLGRFGTLLDPPFMSMSLFYTAFEYPVGMMQGGAHALASVVRVRLPSASSVPLKRAQSAAQSAHPALDSPLCARDATVQLDCSSSTNSFSETGFVETWSSPAPRSLRIPIRTDDSSDVLSRGVPRI